MIILVSFLSVAGSTFFFVSRIHDVYESFSTIVIEEKNMAINQATNTMNPGRSLDFYQGILVSRTFLEMLVDSIGLNIFNSVNPNMTRQDAIKMMQSAFTLKNTEYASILQLNARAPTKNLAFLIAKHRHGYLS